MKYRNEIELEISGRDVLKFAASYCSGKAIVAAQLGYRPSVLLHDCEAMKAGVDSWWFVGLELGEVTHINPASLEDRYAISIAGAVSTYVFREEAFYIDDHDQRFTEGFWESSCHPGSDILEPDSDSGVTADHESAESAVAIARCRKILWKNQSAYHSIYQNLIANRALSAEAIASILNSTNP